jgi:hypothetical protein
MTVARELAEFLTRTNPADLPEQTLEHAAMLIASTLASARSAPGSSLEDHSRSGARARQPSRCLALVQSRPQIADGGRRAGQRSRQRRRSVGR